jgi:hypothetical protein
MAKLADLTSLFYLLFCLTLSKCLLQDEQAPYAECLKQRVSQAHTLQKQTALISTRRNGRAEEDDVGAGSHE